MCASPRNWLIVSIVLSLTACSGDDDEAADGKIEVMEGDPFGNYNPGGVTVIGEGDQPSVSASGTAGSGAAEPPAEGQVLVGTPEGDVSVADSEVCISDTLCEVPPVDASNWCANDDGPTGPVDLIYVDGVLVETICYPPSDDPDRPTETVTSTTGDVDIVQMSNNTTVVFDPATNGMALEGDLSVDGNNVAIFGNGPDETIIDGNVLLDGNTLRLRGVTITGDLILRKNRAAIVLCRIMGNLVLETESTNGSVVAETEVWGNFTSDSNGNLFVNNDVLGTWEHTGNNNSCENNSLFADADGDEVLDDDERTELLPICE